MTVNPAEYVTARYTAGEGMRIVILGSDGQPVRSINPQHAVTVATRMVDLAEDILTSDPPLRASATMGARNLAASMRASGVSSIGELAEAQQQNPPRLVGIDERPSERDA